MAGKIHAACVVNGITLGEGRGALVRLILDSLAESCASTLRELEGLIASPITDVHIVGGGARNTLLNQLTADACDRRVLAGPEEATVLGNLLVQARALGDLPAGVSVREAARRSTRVTAFIPRSANSRIQ